MSIIFKGDKNKKIELLGDNGLMGLGNIGDLVADFEYSNESDFSNINPSNIPIVLDDMNGPGINKLYLRNISSGGEISSIKWIIDSLEYTTNTVYIDDCFGTLSLNSPGEHKTVILEIVDKYGRKSSASKQIYFEFSCYDDCHSSDCPEYIGEFECNCQNNSCYDSACPGYDGCTCEGECYDPSCPGYDVCTCDPGSMECQCQQDPCSDMSCPGYDEVACGCPNDPCADPGCPGYDPCMCEGNC